MKLFDADVLSELVQLNEDNLPFTATIETLVATRNNLTAQYEKIWQVESEQPCRFGPASAGGTNLRMDQPSAAGDWLLVLKAGSAIVAGQRALVRGPGWQRLVLVQRVAAPRTSEMMRKVYCTDAELNPL